MIHDVSPNGLDDPDAVSSDGTHVWVADYGNNGVSEFNASTGDHRKTIS